jgi:hypothetical protein
MKTKMGCRRAAGPPRKQRIHSSLNACRLSLHGLGNSILTRSLSGRSLGAWPEGGLLLFHLTRRSSPKIRREHSAY